jgi:hypothetical protein
VVSFVDEAERLGGRLDGRDASLVVLTVAIGFAAIECQGRSKIDRLAPVEN